MVLGQRFDAALGHAARLHRTQLRKATDVPYVSHLLAVASLVIEDGGDEDEAIAALLHDAVEDQGGVAVLDDIRARFGPRVADIVEACSDSLAEDPAAKAPWRARKEQYLAHMAEAPAAVLRVACADKLHNARCMLAEYRTMGEALWDRFNGGRAGTLWFYRAVATAFARRPGGPLADELGRVVAELGRLAGARDRG